MAKNYLLSYRRFMPRPKPNTAVERAKLFGFDCLRINGKAFAKLHNGRLVMKLPANRIAALVDSGQVNAYEHRGRMLKEWGVVEASKDIIDLKTGLLKHFMKTAGMIGNDL
ncbi:MAG: hypothetical protein HOO93_13210 [Methyloglobulus sp.]|nr:hypothetical protein [Methyloglobulus sp.]